MIAEYEETAAAPSTPRWVKSYVYLGARLLATIAPSGQSERVEYHHPDRLGTRLVTNNQDMTSFEQVTLPFGTALDAESSGSTKRRFTSYDRSTVTGLDYAVNRHYDPVQGRFTQVDPLGMRSTSLANPQTLNLYAYCANDPINRIDPSGLGFFSWLKRVFLKVVAAFVAAVVAVLVAYATGGNFAVAIKVGWAVFKGALSASMGWQPSGGWGRTPPTFGSGPTLRQILGQTSLGRRLSPNKNWFLTPGIAGNGFVAPQGSAIPGQLSDCLKKILGGFYSLPGFLFSRPLNLDRVRFHTGLPAITKYAVIDVGAITLGNNIYFKDASQFTISMLVHELVHTEQYARYAQIVAPPFSPFGEASGIAAFGIQYLAEYVGLRALGKNDGDAYNSISFEREANSRGASILDQIKATYGNNPCGVPL